MAHLQITLLELENTSKNIYLHLYKKMAYLCSAKGVLMIFKTRKLKAEIIPYTKFCR